MRDGERVGTKLGPGTVVRALPEGGALVSVDSLGGLQLKFGAADIFVGDQPSAGQSMPQRVDTAPRDIPIYGPDLSDDDECAAAPIGDLDARLAIEALRFGIVPPLYLEQLTLGYDELEDWVIAALPETTNRCCVSDICGPFGMGKSHTMAAIRRVAEKHGYLTARVEVDGNSVTLASPDSVLRQLWPTLRGEGFESPAPVLDLHLKAHQVASMSELRYALRDTPRVLSNILTLDTLKRYRLEDEHSEELDGFLSCGDTYSATDIRQSLIGSLQRADWAGWRECVCDPKTLVGHRADERPLDFINCLIGYSTLAKKAGFAGLVVTIDEFEVEYNLTPLRQQRVFDLLEEMGEWLEDDEHAKRGALSIFIATVGNDGHTGDYEVEQLRDRSAGGTFEVPSWPRERRRELAEKIHDVYLRAYPDAGEYDAAELSEIEQALAQADLEHEGGQIRAFIKRYVALLDARRGPPVAA